MNAFRKAAIMIKGMEISLSCHSCWEMLLNTMEKLVGKAKTEW
jgi:hypothetical protein